MTGIREERERKRDESGERTDKDDTRFDRASEEQRGKDMDESA